jgi:hypothetical protein
MTLSWIGRFAFFLLPSALRASRNLPLLTDPAALACARVTRRLWADPPVVNCFRCKLVARIGRKADAMSLIVEADVDDSHPESNHIAYLELGC